MKYKITPKSHSRVCRENTRKFRGFYFIIKLMNNNKNRMALIGAICHENQLCQDHVMYHISTNILMGK